MTAPSEFQQEDLLKSIGSGSPARELTHAPIAQGFDLPKDLYTRRYGDCCALQALPERRFRARP